MATIINLTATQVLADGTSWDNPMPICEECTDQIEEQYDGHTQQMNIEEFNEFLRCEPELHIAHSGLVECSCGNPVVFLDRAWVVA